MNSDSAVLMRGQWGDGQSLHSRLRRAERADARAVNCDDQLPLLTR